MRIALLHTRLRVEEQLLLARLQDRGAEVHPIDLRETYFKLDNDAEWAGYDLILDRSLSLTASLTAVRILESFGRRCMNPARTIEICSDKLRTTLALRSAGLPLPRTRAALSPDSGMLAIEDLGYPAVLKPTIGSWGRLLARLNDRDAAEAVLEHRATLGGPAQSVVYAQEHIDKPQRDLRIFVVGGEPVAAVARSSDHWITNTARGASTAPIELTEEMQDMARAASNCVGADLLALDLLECPKRGLLVNELNHSMEFRNSIEVSGVDIAGLIADHAIQLASVDPLARTNIREVTT